MPRAKKQKMLNLALQGGGAHGAFTWGVLDALLENGEFALDAISATSAGAMNAVVLADGFLEGGAEGARAQLKKFWHRVSADSGFAAWQMNPLSPYSPQHSMHMTTFTPMDWMAQMFSPAQINPLGLNPLRHALEEMVDFKRLRKACQFHLFINATNVKTGKVRVFTQNELTLDMVMASACLPFLFPTVYVKGEPYWDGGYAGNPPLYPIIDRADCQDILLVQVNPLYVKEAPTSAAEIMDRIHEISFNSNLMGEIRAIDFVSQLKQQGRLSRDYKDMHLHLIEASAKMAALGQASKFNTGLAFLEDLKIMGKATFNAWSVKHKDAVSKRSSANMKKVFL